MTDQEQTERGASTVVEDAVLVAFAYLGERHGRGASGDCVECHGEWPCHVSVTLDAAIEDERRIRQLRADLERVTAERDQARQHHQAAEADAMEWAVKADQLKAELVAQRGKAMLALAQLEGIAAERDAMREVILAARLLRGTFGGNDLHSVAAGIRRFDASIACLDVARKAAADAAEEGK